VLPNNFRKSPKNRGIEMTIFRILFIVLFVGSFCFVSPTLVEADGNHFLKSCNAFLAGLDSHEGINYSGLQYIEAGHCSGFIKGIMEFNRLYQLGSEPFFCLPENSIPNVQAIRIVVKYLRDHPERLHKNALFLVVDAFVEAFPCKIINKE